MKTVHPNLFALCILWLCLTWMTALPNEHPLFGQQPSNTQRIVLANGDRLPVKLVEFKDKALEFGSPLFYETVSLEQNHVKAIQFSERNETSSTGTMFSLRLRNGSQLTGQILELDESHCVLDSLAVGKVEIPVANLLEVRKWNSETAPSTERIAAANWYELGESFQLDTQGRISLGRKVTATLDPILQVNTKAGMEFRADENTSFQWTVKLDGKPTHSINIAKGSIVVESGDELSFGEFPVEQDLGYVAIQLLPDELQILDAFEQVLISIPQPEFESASCELVSEDGPLKIRSFTIQNSQKAKGYVADLASNRHAVVQEQPGSIRFDELSFSEGRFVFVDSEANVEKIDSTKLERIWFGVSDQSATSEKNNFTLIWANGDQLGATGVEFEDSKLSVVEGEWELEDIVIELAPTIVCIENDDATETADRDQRRNSKSFGLAIGGVPFSGQYSWGDDKNPIQWRFEGFSDPVSLNVSRKIEIRRRKASSRNKLKLGEDRLLFHDGTIIPCQMEEVGETQARFTSQVTRTRDVDRSSIKGIFFEHAKISSALKRLTKESINRALRIPRFADEVEYTHILLAANGDLLRGRLVRLDQDHVIFESNLQKVKILRSKVLGVIAIDGNSEDLGNAKDEEETTDQPEIDDSESQTTVQINCGDNFKAVGKYVSLDSNSAILESPTLGRLEVKQSQILQIAFNSPLNDASVLDSFAKWNFGTAIEPRWTEDVPVAPEASLLMGQPAPDFELAVLDGKKQELFRLSDQLGKVVVIDFWATHSTPCEMAMPGYLEVTNQFSKDDVVFAAINQSEPATRVSRFVKSKKWSGGKFLLDSENIVGREFSVSAVPHLTVIDKKGKIQFIKVGYSPKAADQLRETIEKLLKE